MTAITHIDVWNALTPDERREACLAIWISDDRVTVKVRPMVYSALAEVMRFREKFLRQQTKEKLADWLLNRMQHRNLRKNLSHIIRAWLLSCHAEMIESFLDACGIAREGCFVVDDAPPAHVEEFRKGIKAIRKQNGDRFAALYLGYMLSERTPHFSTPLPDALKIEAFDLAAVVGSGSDVIGELPVADDSEEVAMPEDNEAMTTLDALLIKSVVASVLGTEGSMPHEVAEHLVEEVIDLNAERHRSHFHRGFFHALFGRDPAFDFPGVNEQRKSWYTQGLMMGYLRKSDHHTCVQLLKARKDLRQILFTSTTTPCGANLLIHLYEQLRDTGEFGMIREWVSNKFIYMTAPHRKQLLDMLQEDGSSLLRRGMTSEAQILLELVDYAILNIPVLDPCLRTDLLPRNMRKRAQVMQAQGNFNAAQEILEKLLAMSDIPDAANAMADLGLIKGGFRSLTAILPHRDVKLAASRRDALEMGRADFEAAVIRHPDGAANAYFCLGMFTLLGSGSQSEDTADLFRHALSDMLKREDFYVEGGLIDWARFGLAYALLETVETANLQQAAERLNQVMDSDIVVPDWLWVNVLKLASMFDDRDLVQRLVDHLLNVGGRSIFITIQDEALHTLPGIRRPFFDWLQEQTLPCEKRWVLLENMLLRDNSPEEIELNREILDIMEVLAVDDEKCRARMISLLTTTTEYEPAWVPADAELALIRYHEVNGDYAQATHYLAQRFYRLRDHGERHEVFEARQIAERIHSYGLKDDPSASLLASLTALEGEQDVAAGVIERLKSGEMVSILYIGGNEKQECYADQIKASLAEQYPGLKVELYFPGWNSWSVHLEKVKPMIRRSDGVVLNTLVRTHFGGHVRDYCGNNHPWISCTGRGRKSLEMSIERAALWALERRKKVRY